MKNWKLVKVEKFVEKLLDNLKSKLTSWKVSGKVEKLKRKFEKLKRVKGLLRKLNMCYVLVSSWVPESLREFVIHWAAYAAKKTKQQTCTKLYFVLQFIYGCIMLYI